MSISKDIYRQLLREYDAKALKAARELSLRTQKIENELPELSKINSRIAEISVDTAVSALQGKTGDKKACKEERERLISRKKQILEDAGYTMADLMPVYECSKCKDTGYTAAGTECSCFKARIIDFLYDQSNIRDVLEKENFDTYSFKYYSQLPLSPDAQDSPLSLAKKAYDNAWDFVHHFRESSANLFITGGTGTGKTFLCNCIAREILNQGYSVIYLSSAKLFSSITDNVKELISCDLLIIDDLGTEFTNPFVQSAFFNCINERLLRRRHTVISTNYSIEQVKRVYSERVFSRITQKYTYIKLDGNDIRIIRKLEG